MSFVRKLGLAVLLSATANIVMAAQFVVDDIVVQGLQRVSLGSVLSSLSIREGDLVDEQEASQWLRDVYQIGYFHDVTVDRIENNIVFNVVERPAIAKVEFKGNSSIPTDTLESVFKDIGLAEGEIFSRSLLENIDLELEKQYSAQGRYNAGVETDVISLTRNRVNIKLDISEGPVAEVLHIEFTGNNIYSDEELHDVMQLKESGVGGLIGAVLNKDRFSSAALTGDIQRIEDWYFDHGYLDYQLDSRQVTISENKADITVALNISEGLPYSISDVQVTGDLKHLSKEINELVNLNIGDLYSRREVATVVRNIKNLLDDNGYAFSTVKDFRQTDAESQTVDVVLQVQLGRPVYVNRIVIKGNSATNDEVIRREFRQLERGLLINSKVNLSRARLMRLGYFSSVDIETKRLRGRDDVVDLVVTLVETKDSQLNISGGYAAGSGFFAEVALTQKNFAGLGIDFSASVKVDGDTQNYELSLENPYFTLDGVSLGADVFYRNSDYSTLTSSTYATNSYGARIRLGYPLSENQRMVYGLGANRDELFLSASAPLEMTDFLDENGSVYDVTSVRVGWSYNTLNGTIKANDGATISTNVEAAVVPGDLQYYIATANAQRYFNINEDYAFRIHTDLGYGEGYGNSTLLPFYRNFYAGGSRSVRGFRRGSLGPLGTVPTDNEGNELFNASPIGGNIKVEYGAELLIPTPLVENQNAYRTSIFVDAGNVFSNQCRSDNANCSNGVDLTEIRYSAGIDFTWITPIAPLSFSYAWPLNARESDTVANFAFNIGVSY